MRPTPEEIEAGLTDKYWMTRQIWGLRTDFTPTPEQIERGLADNAPGVRMAWIKRKAYIDRNNLVPTQGRE